MTHRLPCRGEKGFMLVFSIIILLVLSISIPALVNWVRQETKDTVKVKRSSTAFHLAEAGVDQAMWKLQEARAVWTAARAGTAVSGYDGNTQYTLSFQDGATGYYNIRFTSGPSTGQVTVLAKGRDPSTRELRAIQAIFEENGAGTFAIQAKKTSSFGAATSVEWGPVISKTIINSGNKTHPRLLSSSNISPNDANGSADPNTDAIQWWSYKSDLPPDPLIDFASYKSSAQAYGSSADSDCGSYYKNVASFQFKGCQDQTGRVFYIEYTGGPNGGNCNFASGSGGNFVKGDIICLGDFSITGNGGGNGTETLPVPSQAWVEYGNDWTYYDNNFDAACPHATYAAARTASYNPTGLTKSISNILIHGFIYTGGSQGLTGGGNGVMVGALYSANDASMTTSNCTLYFDPASASSIRTTNVTVTRESWKEVVGVSWP